MFQKALHYDMVPVYDLVMDYWINWEQLGIVHLPSFILGTIAIVLLPGPNSLYVLTTASQSGWRPGVWASLGIVAGDSVLILAVVLGAASLLHSSPTLFLVLRLVGAVYLLWIGWGLIQIAWQRYWGREQIKATSMGGRLLQMHPFIAALGLSLTNPKAIFFFISFFTQFVMICNSGLRRLLQEHHRRHLLHKSPLVSTPPNCPQPEKHHVSLAE